MGYNKQYVWRSKEGEAYHEGGFEPADILCQHYDDDKFRTVVLDADDLKGMAPWKLCSLLNEVYRSGRADAMSDLRNFIGVK